MCRSPVYVLLMVCLAETAAVTAALCGVLQVAARSPGSPVTAELKHSSFSCPGGALADDRRGA